MDLPLGNLQELIFHKAPKPTNQTTKYAEMQSVYSTAPADWTMESER